MIYISSTIIPFKTLPELEFCREGNEKETGTVAKTDKGGNEQSGTHMFGLSKEQLSGNPGVGLSNGEQQTKEEVHKRNLSEKLEHEHKHKHSSSDYNSHGEASEMSTRERKAVEEYLLLRADTASLVGVLGTSAGKVHKAGGMSMREQRSDVSDIGLELCCTNFFSIVFHWIICFFKKPMELFGLLLEFFLNGGNLSCSIRNILTGRIPETDSKNRLSAVGHLDTRVHLHKFCNKSAPEEIEEIENPGLLEGRVMMDICVMASKIVYENADVVESIINKDWKMHFVNFYSFWNAYRKEASTQAFIMCDKRKDADLILISFCGAKIFDANDLCMGLDYSWCHVPGMGKVHVGFLEALGLGTRDEISSIISSLQGPNPNSDMLFVP